MSVAVVTGASSGLGRVIARSLLGAGWQVALAGRREELLAETAKPADSAPSWPDDAALVVPADEIDLADWQRVVDTNLTGVFLCAQHAVRMMKAQDPRGGRIINNGSISAHTPRPNSIAYTATKHAVTGLTKSLSLDGRAFGIACGQIDIGNAETELTRRFSQGVLQANGSIAAEPVFDSRHVADAVLYMASLPLDANVQFLTITATTMPYIGRG